MKRYLEWFAVTAVLASGASWVCAQSVSALDSARKIPWIIDNASRLAAIFPNKEAIGELQNATLSAADRDADSPQTIGEYQIVDLNHDGGVAPIRPDRLRVVEGCG
jgi:hypothetical protein